MDIESLIDSYIETENFVEKKYLEYSVATLAERAIPYLQDGLKPVHRRILYAMKDMGNISTAKHKKSARIVGDVIGKYHPHGDSSVYEAMVRLSQEWNLRYPLVDGQGNFGSRDGDSAAAMRYTESRLTKFAEEALLSEIKLGTVDFRPNYDNVQEEPVFLPAKLNIALLNGASGIAVGMATDIPSHNIREVTDATLALIKNPNMSHEEIMEIIKGPDYPEGGQIIDSQEAINKVYEEGSGTVRVRAKWKVEKLPRGQWQVVVEELPPNMNTKKILEKIDKITNPQPAKDKSGKSKPLSKKVLADKLFMTNILSKAVDESDKKTPVRLVLEPKSSRQTPEDFMSALIARIDLEQNIKVNFTLVGLDNLPKVKSIKEILLEWIDFRFEVLTRRTKFSLNKTKSRIHILEGRLIALNNIDEVIKIIKDSETPKEDLINSYGVSEIQAEDILEIKLRQLAKLESERLMKELESLLKEEKRLEALLSSKTKMNNLMSKEIEEITQVFEDNRRTELKPDKMIVAKSSDAVLDEPVTAIITKQNWLTLRKGHDFDSSNLQLKTGDEIKEIIECRTVDNIAMLATNGRGYSIKVSDIPSGKGSFIHINNLITLPTNVNIVSTILVEENELYLFSNEEGYGFISKIDNLVSKNKAGKHFMTITNEKFKIFKPIKLEEDLKRLNVLSTDNRLLSYYLEEVKELDKGKGVQLIRLAKGEKIKELSLSKQEEINYKEKNKNKFIRSEELLDYHSKRALRGKTVSEDFSLVF